MTESSSPRYQLSPASLMNFCHIAGPLFNQHLEMPALMIKVKHVKLLSECSVPDTLRLNFPHDNDVDCHGDDEDDDDDD